MTKEEFFRKIEKNILCNRTGSLCGNVVCNECPLKQKDCLLHFPITPKDFGINDFLIQEYEKYKAEIIVEKIK